MMEGRQPPEATQSVPQHPIFSSHVPQPQQEEGRPPESNVLQQEGQPQQPAERVMPSQKHGGESTKEEEKSKRANPFANLDVKRIEDLTRSIMNSDSKRGKRESGIPRNV